MINIIPLYVVIMCTIGRFSARLYVVYSVFYVVGTLLSMQVPLVKFRPVQSSEHMAALAAFLLLQSVAAFHYGGNLLYRWRGEISRQDEDGDAGELLHIQKTVLVRRLGAGVLAIGCCACMYRATGVWRGGAEARWGGSVGFAEADGAASFNGTWPTRPVEVYTGFAGQPSTWAAYFLDMHVVVALTPVGLYFCFDKLTDAKVFIVTYAIAAAYFSGIMVRMMLFLCPVVCICAGIGLSAVLKARMRDLTTRDTYLPRGPEHSLGAAATLCSPRSRLPQPVAALTVAAVGWLLVLYVQHSVWCASESSAAGPRLAPGRGAEAARGAVEDYREGHRWMAENLPRGSRLLVWPDCGLQMSAVADLGGVARPRDEEPLAATLLVGSCCADEPLPWPLLARRHGCNQTLAGGTSSILSMTEEAAWAAMERLDVDMVLLFLGGDASALPDPWQRPLVRAGANSSSAPADAAEIFSSRRGVASGGEEADYAGHQRIDGPGGAAPHKSLLHKLANHRSRRAIRVSAARACSPRIGCRRPGPICRPRRCRRSRRPSCSRFVARACSALAPAYRSGRAGCSGARRPGPCAPRRGAGGELPCGGPGRLGGLAKVETRDPACASAQRASAACRRDQGRTCAWPAARGLGRRRGRRVGACTPRACRPG